MKSEIELPFLIGKWDFFLVKERYFLNINNTQILGLLFIYGKYISYGNQLFGESLGNLGSLLFFGSSYSICICGKQNIVNSIYAKSGTCAFYLKLYR